MKHPGIILFEQFMKPRKTSQNSLARQLHVPPQRINEIVNGKRGITLDTAIRLGTYFDNPPSFWLEIQTYYELEKAEEAGVVANIQQEVVGPQALLHKHQRTRHKQIENKALAIHKLVALKLQADPGLVLGLALKNIQEWGWDQQECPAAYVTAWKQLLKKPIPQIINIITSPGEKGTHLRSSSPFEGALTAEEKQTALRNIIGQKT